jgi:hypothetical protein
VAVATGDEVIPTSGVSLTPNVATMPVTLSPQDDMLVKKKKTIMAF